MKLNSIIEQRIKKKQFYSLLFLLDVIPFFLYFSSNSNKVSSEEKREKDILSLLIKLLSIRFLAIQLSCNGSVGQVDQEPYSGLYLTIFLMAQLLHGAGSAPFYTLGVTYLDENVSKKMSSVYVGKRESSKSICYLFKLA